MTLEQRPGRPHKVEREHVGLGPYLLTRLQLPKYGDGDLLKIQGTIPEGVRLILQAHSARYGAEEISTFVTAYERGITRGEIDPKKLEVGIDLVQKMRIRFPTSSRWLDDRSTISNGIPARIVRVGDWACIGFDPDDEGYRYKHQFDWNIPTEGVQAMEEFTRPDLQYVLSADDIPQLEALRLNRNFRIGQPVHMLTVGDQGVRILVTDTVGTYGSAKGIVVDEGEGLGDGLKVVRNGDGVINPAAINHGRAELLGPRDVQILEEIPAELRSHIAHITLSFAESSVAVATAVDKLRKLGYSGGCYAKVETPNGIQNISEIGGLEDLAGIVFGLGDLGAAMGDNKYPATIQALSTLRAGKYNGSVAIADDYPYPNPSDVPNLHFQEMVTAYGRSLSRWITGKGMRAKDPQLLQGVLTNGFTPL